MKLPPGSKPTAAHVPREKPVKPPGTSATALAIILAALAMLGPFSVDTYLPAFPAIEASLGASAIQVQQTLSAYMLAFAIMILWHGAISDALGRRNIILVALGVFAIGSLGCAAAHSIHYLWAFRILQGISAGVGVVVGRAMIRDLYSGAAAERLLSLVTMIFSIGPAIAPIIGGWIVSLLDWRSIFLFMVAYTLLLFWACYLKLPETLPPSKRIPLRAEVLWQSYRLVFTTPLFHLKAAVLAFNFAGLFLYVSAAPVFLIQHLKLGPHEFAWLFMTAVSGIFLGALSANRVAGKIPVGKQVGIAYVLLMGAAVANVLYHSFFPPALPWSVLPLFFYSFGMSLAAPAVTLFVLDLFPHIRGIASSCQSFTQTMLGAVVAGVVAPFLSHSVLWLAAGQTLFVLISMVCWFLGRTYHGRLTRPINAWETVE
jgi:DHA1 family bicyclomycin/chloramphenicol resistance-like MFS transporter